MSGSLKEKVLIGVGVGLGASVLTGLYYWYHIKTLNAYPKSWRHVGTLSDLAFCPLKSCRTIKLNEAYCGILGVEDGKCRDHMLMLVDKENKVVAARTYPHMVKINVELASDKLIVTAPNMELLEIDYATIDQGKSIKANILDQDVYVVECGSKYDKWFTRYIQNKDEGLRLVYYAHSVPTKIIVKKWLKNGVFLNEDTGTLHDISSFMLINEKSVEDLNTRLKRPVDIWQFRPNFIVKNDGPAYDEDNWKWIKIGNEAVFRTVCPCYRCIFPNINITTAMRDPDGEPLKTLKTYRMDNIHTHPIMGLQLAIRTPGVVKMGDDVYVGV